MPVRTSCDPIEILQAFERRLVQKIAIYNDQNCFISDDPIPWFMPGGKECCTVSIGGGTFPAAMFGGGGLGTLTEDMTITITTIVRHVRDRPRHRDQVMMSPIDGLVQRRAEILYALLNEDWEPTSIDGARFLLRDQLTPQSTSAPGSVRIGDIDCIGAGISFYTPFDWKLDGIICQQQDHGEA